MSVRNFYAQSQCAIIAATTLALVIAMQGIASAHPGHGITTDGDTPAHYLIEPTHGISVTIALVAALAVAYIIRSRVITSRE